MRFGLGLSLLASAFAFAAPAYAADAEEERVAIQRRKFQMAHELRFSVGSMPLDPFQKGWSASLSYTAHFDNYWGWEVFQITGALLSSTNLRDELIDTFAIPPEDFAAPRFMVTTGIELTPFYGKQVALNDGTVHQSVLAGLYGGLIFGDRETLGDTFSDIRPAIGLGLGYRFFLGKSASFRIDVRDFLSLKRAIRANETLDAENVLMMTLSIGFNLFRDDA